MLRLLLGRDWTKNRREILSRIAGDVHRREGGRILIVPELITHEMERLLCAAAGDTASRYAEVLSFTRMARRVADASGSAAMECLDGGGRIVAMASAAKQLSGQLKAYASVETKPEFLANLIAGIDEFKRCRITPEDLMLASQRCSGGFAQKLQELSLLMEGYDAVCAQGKRDPRDEMTWLLERLEEGSFGREHTFYIDGFPDFTQQNMAVVRQLILDAPCVTVSMNCDSLGSGKLAFEKASDTAAQLYRWAKRAGIPVELEEIREDNRPLRIFREQLYQGSLAAGAEKGRLFPLRADSPYGAVLHAAGEVRRLVAGGCRYRDITLVCTDMAAYQPLVDLVFNRFRIPVYRAGTEEILSKSVIVTVLSALDAVLSGFDQKPTLRYLRSALSPLDADSCDRVENYVIIWNIRGQKWLRDWENHPEGLSGQWTDAARDSLAELNGSRSLAMAPLEELSRGLREAKNVREQTGAVYDFLEAIGMERRLESLAREMDEAGDNRSAQILNQLWEILVSALEQLYDVLGETSWEEEHFCRLLRLLLSQYSVGTIPPVLDAVQMGAISAMRCHSQEHLIVLGAEEGKLPGYSSSGGVLTDQERVQLRGLGVPLTGGAAEGIQEEFAEIYGVFCGAMSSVRMYSAEEQPSFLYRRAVLLAGGEARADNVLGMAEADAQEAGAALAGWNAREISDRLGVADAYRRTLERKNYTLGRIAPEGIRALYGTTLNLSASQIDRQAQCRLSYFLKYGLRARERKQAEVDPAEFGTYVHAVLENTARCVRDMGGFHRVSLEQTLGIAHRFSEEYAAQRFSQLDSRRAVYLFRRNLRELDMVVEELWQELSQAEFSPVGFEVSFGGEGALAPIAIPNSGMNALLRGFVDRVDAWTSGKARFYRVVDYKTGKKDFDYCDIFNGVGLQMLLYLFALREDGGELLGDNPVPAGVQYFPARVPYLSAYGRLDGEEAEKEREKNWKRKGLLLNDPEVLRAMEPGETPGRSYTLRKDGSPSGDLADRAQLKLLEKYVFQILAEMVEDIASGDVEPNPYTRGTSHSACDFCPYGDVCHAGQVEGRRNYKTMTAQRFWEEIGKKVRENG